MANITIGMSQSIRGNRGRNNSPRLNLWRASFIPSPFIALATWRFKAVYLTFLLYIVVDILLAPSHLFEHII